MKTDSGHSERSSETITDYLKRSLKPRKGYTILKLLLPKRLQDSVGTYLDSSGLEDSEGIATLIEFGLGLSNNKQFAIIHDEIRRLKERLSELDLRLGHRKLDAYENLMENKALSVELASLLSENQLLLKRMRQHNLLDKRWRAQQHEEMMRTAELFLSKYTFQPKL